MNILIYSHSSIIHKCLAAMPLSCNMKGVICVWAYVAQIKLDELLRQFGNTICIQYHFLHLFGDVGYKVIEANIEELLANPGERASWC